MSQTKVSEIAISSYGVTLQLSARTLTKASKKLRTGEKTNLTKGKAPETDVAAALYIAGILENEPRTQAKVGQATGVSANTLQRRKTQFDRIWGIRKQ